MYEIDKKRMANKIKSVRKSAGLTQEQAAEQVGITYSSYVKIENAFQTPSLPTLASIALVLQVSLDELVFDR